MVQNKHKHLKLMVKKEFYFSFQLTWKETSTVDLTMKDIGPPNININLKIGTDTSPPQNTPRQSTRLQNTHRQNTLCQSTHLNTLRQSTHLQRNVDIVVGTMVEIKRKEGIRNNWRRRQRPVAERLMIVYFFSYTGFACCRMTLIIEVRQDGGFSLPKQCQKARSVI